MKKIIEWLITIEHTANETYQAAADFFRDNKELACILNELASEEAEHYHLMVSALNFVDKVHPEQAYIEIDADIKTRIEAPFIKAKELLDSGQITEQLVIDCIVESEYSEWNEFFDYVINTLKHTDRIFACSASRIDNHLRRLDNYLNSTSYGREKLKELALLPYRKKANILIVDDDQAILELISRLLKDICDSDRAVDGADALNMLSTNIYDLIISDIDMPEMSGTELYKRATQLLSKPNERFIFHTGNMTSELQSFFESQHLTYFEKPHSINKIRNTVKNMCQLK